MGKNTTKIRIKDIASMAGVSEGTVDRVLHNRGEVSEKSREIVQKVLDELHYKPNMYARSLALKKQYHFIFFMPSYKEGDYWESVDKGIEQAIQEFADFNVVISKHFYNQFDRSSFVQESKLLISENPDAVVIAPTFGEETRTLVTELKSCDIAYSFIDSMIDDDGFLNYYGQYSFQSGYIAAKLLLADLPEKSTIMLVRTQRTEGAVSNQTQNRYEGFMEYVNDNGLQNSFRFVTVLLHDGMNESNEATLLQVFKTYGEVKAAIIFNSTVSRLATYFERLEHTDVRLIGYDLLADNVKYLKSGAIDILIAQRPEKQAYLILRDLCRALVFKQEVKRLNYIPIDILLKENIDYYMDFQE